MKIILFWTLMTSLSFNALQAQVTTVTDEFCSNLTKHDLNFSGARVLHCIGLNDRNTENYIVVSKNGQGESNDQLFIEKFTKTSNGFEGTFTTSFAHTTNLALSFVNNRMSYSDVDKDGNAEFIYVIEEHPAGPRTPANVSWAVLVYNNQAYKIYTLEEEDFEILHQDESIKELPADIQAYFVTDATNFLQ